jgi:hypothetical protein
MEKLTEVTLDSLGGGLAQEIFSREMDRVLANIDDPNTDPQQSRKITLIVTFKPEKSRTHASVLVSSKSVLAGIRPAETEVHLYRHGGRLVATEDDVHQPSLFAGQSAQVIEGGANGSHP